jgi:hypothetical protein
MDHRTVEYNFESGPTKDPPNSIWFHLDQWFLSRRFQCDFFIKISLICIINGYWLQEIFYAYHLCQDEN